MSKILYLFLLGTCLVNAMDRGPSAMPSMYGAAPRPIPTQSVGPSAMPPTYNTLAGLPIVNLQTFALDDSPEVSSHASDDVPEEIENMDERQAITIADMLDNANIRFGKNSYYDPRGYMANTITLVDIMRNIRVTLTKNRKTGRYTLKITIDPIWAPTDITTMPQDELEKQLGRKKRRNMSPQQTSKQAQKKSRARRVEMPDIQDMRNMQMRDIGLF